MGTDSKLKLSSATRGSLHPTEKDQTNVAGFVVEFSDNDRNEKLFPKDAQGSSNCRQELSSGLEHNEKTWRYEAITKNSVDIENGFPVWTQ